MLPSLHLPLSQSNQSNRLTMKRKFGLGHLKVGHSNTANNGENWDTLDKSVSRDDYTYTHVPLAPSLDAKTESELRKACAFILKDLKPSGHDLEDTRMKTDILVGGDDFGQDNKKLLSGEMRSSTTQNRHWPLSKRDATRSKDRTGREKSALENSLDSWGEEKADGRISRSENRSSHQSRRRATTAVADEGKVPVAPVEFLPKITQPPVPKPKEEGINIRNNTLPVDSSENSSLEQSVGSMNQIRSTSTGITSAMITPAWHSQRTSENGVGSAIIGSVASVPTTVTKRQAQAQQTPERPKTPSMITSRAMGSNLEAQAVPIISRRATSRGPAEASGSQVVLKNKSLSDLRSATPKVEIPPRPQTPEPSRARSLKRMEDGPSVASISVENLTTQTHPSQILSRIRGPGAPPLFDTDDSSSVTDDDSSSQEDKEHYLLDTNTPGADEPAAGTSAQGKVSEKASKQTGTDGTEISNEEEQNASSPQPFVHPKNPLRYSEIDLPLVEKEQKLSHDIRDKSEEPLATARARIDAREHSKHASVYLDQQQPSQQQQEEDPMWETDAKPPPLNLKSKISSNNLGSSVPEGTYLTELPVLSQSLAIEPGRYVPIHVPSPLPPLKHEHDESITVKDFWKPAPKPAASESVRSFSRPGTGGGNTQHRRQPAQEVIDGLVQPLRPFSPVTTDGRSYSPVPAAQAWSAEYVPTRSSERVAVAGPSGQSGYKRHASMTREAQQDVVYRPSIISVQPGTPAASSTYPRLSSMNTSTYPRLNSMANSTHRKSSSHHQRRQPQPAAAAAPKGPESSSPPDIDKYYNQYRQSNKNLDPAKAAPVIQSSTYNPTSPPKGGLKKLLHRLGGGDMPDRRKAYAYGNGARGGEGVGAAIGDDGYYDDDGDDENGDDLACEAPVVRFGRGW